MTLAFFLLNSVGLIFILMRLMPPSRQLPQPRQLNDKPFACRVCLAEYSTGQALSWHIAGQHGNRFRVETIEVVDKTGEPA